MKNASKYVLFAFLTVTALFVGCSGKEKTYSVSGTVSYKGELVPDGSISFVPNDPKKDPQGAPIHNGQYSAQVRKGTMTVRITGSKPDPKKKMLDGSPFWTDFVPEKYGAQSALTVEIKGSQTENFDLN
ncbi:MAG: hypothetical protein IKS45_10105 [Thermoguttaceae bacterium]|nr:hypothetical protein [Thermoguttaceae bacterium]